MTCPDCGAETKVVDSRTTSNNHIRRKRECLTCKKRHTTYEFYREEVILPADLKWLGAELKKFCNLISPAVSFLEKALEQQTASSRRKT